MCGLASSLEGIAAASAAEDAEAAEFSRFKVMLQELQQAVQASQAGAEGQAEPQSIKNSAAFKQAGAMLRGWIERFENSSQPT